MQFEVNTSFTSSKKMDLQTVESRMGKPILLYLGYRLLKKKNWIKCEEKFFKNILLFSSLKTNLFYFVFQKFKYVPVICPIFKLGSASKNFR